MSDNQEQAEAAGAEGLSMVEGATPPSCSAPMPRQVIIFWTPRVIFAAGLQALKLHALKGLRHPRGAGERATISVRNLDEPR